MAGGENSPNRSTKVRSRRMQRRVGKAVQRRTKGARSRKVPAMVARNPRMDQVLNSGRREVRRRIPLKLATEGAELHLPALPVLRLGWRAFSALTMGTLLALLVALLWHPIFTMSRVELAGAQRIDAQDVNTLLGLGGSSVFALRPAQINEAVAAAFPELADFKLDIAFPARVVLHVAERAPAIAWQQSGITVWVDAAGIAFIPSGEETDLVTVQALEAPPALESGLYARQQFVRPEMVDAILALSAHSPDDVSLLFDPKLGFGWEDPRGWSVYFGTGAEDMAQRLDVYQSLVADLTARGLAPTLISVVHLHAPYYRMDY